MVYSTFQDIRIAAIAAAVPEGIQSIFDFEGEEDTRVIKKFIRNTGIESVHRSDFEHTASDYGVAAVKAIHDHIGFDYSDIGVLVNITHTPDYRMPSTACAINYRLGLDKSCIAFDVNLGCSGFVYGLNIAASLLHGSNANKAIVIVGDTLARGRYDYLSGRVATNTDMLFGDASSAVLLEKSVGKELSVGLMTDGAGFKALRAPYGGWKHPFGPEKNPSDDIEVFNFTINEVPKIINDYLEIKGESIESYDALVLHQANKMIIKQIAKKLSVSMEKVPVSLDRYGNTSGASVPLTIVDKYGDDNEGVVKIIASGYGVGLSWGVTSFEIEKANILPVVIGAESFDDGYTNYDIDNDEWR